MPACSPRTFSCSCAAGRRVSSEAISTFSFCRSASRRAILAAVVVLPEPCRPTSISGTGAGALRSIGCASEPSISTSWSWTILTTIWPGVTERMTSCADGARAHLVGERAHHVERDVGLDQRAAHLAHRLADVGLRQRAAPGQPVEDATEAFRQGFEHSSVSFQAYAPAGASALADAGLRSPAPVGFSYLRLFSELAGIYETPAGKSTKGRAAVTAMPGSSRGARPCRRRAPAR